MFERLSKDAFFPFLKMWKAFLKKNQQLQKKKKILGTSSMYLYNLTITLRPISWSSKEQAFKHLFLSSTFSFHLIILTAVLAQS